MTTPAGITAKNILRAPRERLIRVLIANQESKEFNATTFSETEIERVMEIGEDRSALVLRSGIQIPVALSYEQLEQKIYERDFRIDGPVLDLRYVTGEAVKPTAANANEAPTEPKVGDKMPDGTVFAGISPDTSKPMYVTATEASLTMTFNKATKYAAQLDAHGHKDWRVPTKDELSVLFHNSAAIGVTVSRPAGWYWSASPYSLWSAWCQRLSDGAQDDYDKNYHLFVRPVR